MTSGVPSLRTTLLAAEIFFALPSCRPGSGVGVGVAVGVAVGEAVAVGVGVQAGHGVGVGVPTGQNKLMDVDSVLLFGFGSGGLPAAGACEAVISAIKVSPNPAPHDMVIFLMTVAGWPTPRLT